MLMCIYVKKDESQPLCRLCRSSCCESIDIFDPKGHNGLLIWTVLKELLQFDVTTADGLPSTICDNCLEKVTEFKYFKTMCINSRIEFLKAMVNRGLVPGTSEVVLSFPRSSLSLWKTQTKHPAKAASPVEVIEISEESRDSNASSREDELERVHVKVEKSESISSRDSYEGEEDDDEGSMVDGDSSDGEMESNSSTGENDDGEDDGVEAEGVDAEGSEAEGAEVEEDDGVEDETLEEPSEVGDKPSEEDSQCFQCTEPGCNRTFNLKRYLRSHVTFAHSGGRSQCPFCSYKAFSRVRLDVHIRQSHENIPDVGAYRPKRISISPPKTEPKKGKPVDTAVKSSPQVLLKDCTVSIDSKPLVNQVKQSQKSSTNLSQSPISTEMEVEEDTTPGKKILFCKVCLMPFQDKASVRAHMERMHSQSTYTCHKCSKSFVKYHQFRKHSEMHLERKEMPYVCPRCGADFNSMNRIREHMKERHSFPAVIICEVCRSAFTKSGLDHHSCQLFRNLFPCPLCKQRFRHRSNVKAHIMRCKGTSQVGKQ
ncbi:zinc finger protein 235-like [Ischnura elegans]|uniref:zinc finger protein 235-like n=1 Tax=Ischnura elegans TaxID=197161 RepID=UPI001ED8BE9B|nr:zinc finger protein 235-like [Ischnura elegans]